jgi:hypothetical protein
MDSKVKKASPQRDPVTGKFLSKREQAELAAARDFVSGITIPPLPATPLIDRTLYNTTQQPIPSARPVMDFGYLDQSLDEQRVEKEYSRFLKRSLVIPLVIGILIVLTVAVTVANSATIQPQDHVIASCRAKMVGVLVTERMISTGSKFSESEMLSLQQDMLSKLAKNEPAAVKISEWMSIRTACQMMWTSLTDQYLVIPRTTRTRFPTPRN